MGLAVAAVVEGRGKEERQNMADAVDHIDIYTLM